MRRLFPYKKLIILVLLVAASVFLMNITGAGDTPSLWEKILWKGMQPFLDGLLAVKDKFGEYSALFQQKEALAGKPWFLRAGWNLSNRLTRLKEIENEN